MLQTTLDLDGVHPQTDMIFAGVHSCLRGQKELI